MTAAAPVDLRELEQDPRLFLYTSLTAGSSHIFTATSRMETILKANKIPFIAVDTATDEKARRLWVRRAGKRKLPGLVKQGYVIGDIDEVEEWNEYGELKETIGPVPAANTPATTSKPGSLDQAAPPKPASTANRIALPGAAEIAARNKAAAAPKSAPPSSQPATDDTAAQTSQTPVSAINEKLQSVRIAGAVAGEDHLSAPPSQFQSGAATPAQHGQEEGETKEEVEEPAKPPSAIPKTLLAESHPNLEHLSAPASQLHSETTSPAGEPSGGVGDGDGVDGGEEKKQEHRGSEIQDAPEDVVKAVEEKTKIAEEPDEDHDHDTAATTATTTATTAATTTTTTTSTQEQGVKSAVDAGTSVED